MVLAGLRRLFLLILGAAGLTALGSVVIAALIGSSYGRALTVGFYLVGCFLMLAGFFIGNRGPARVKAGTCAGRRSASRTRRSTTRPCSSPWGSCWSRSAFSSTRATRSSDQELRQF